ncbi:MULTISPECIES: multidrug efflux RND transporter periplasmic adaptor subunit AdeD [Acinetobacter]|jgi:membrane fusion protein (multidrug efflux system)|uniref:Multidrug efflux RND transporter periplasmic adaptor subunit AdeD n=1 Tax=Acinetobacter pittii TaxID=48296 RepID=A0AAE9S981_ACIPI|nr:MULTISPECIES: multidrug efflux RND transporter periplasmic adaptor subunit AdeD [Acinetobacter calcoaceticus/baumannii complex]AZP28454.1 efflux RND transporter periplasmic adaptor subunit [Acinetobacter pittii]EXE24724.1 efflux transporter, RND family, MFP subunit [Acinetobacter sp. 907131]EXS18348.1 efflux transporter, RND family, MFP subunit [Acinetobacter sp. 883425]MBK0412539.1 multidrug efflux RND transporter periplasmic adaptor subunit AdeD [Acinetobacter pittii]MBK1418639.1 multidru
MLDLSFNYRKFIYLLPLFVFLNGCDSDQPAPKNIQQVGTITIKPETIESTYQLAGRTVASEISQVRPQVNGVVIEQLFKEGTQVNKGQPLYKIDSSLYRDSVDEAAGNLALAKATVNSTRLQAERYKELIKVNGVSQQEFDNAQSAYEQAKATVAVNEAVLKTARTNLRYTQVSAPISGRIGRSSITRGALVTSAQTDPLATIQKLDPMYVDLTQSSDEYMALRKQLTENGIKPTELSVRLKLENGTVYAEQGTFKFSDVAVDEATGSVTLRAAFPNPNNALLPGLYVRAELGTGTRPNSVLIPQGALFRDAEGNPLVWIVGKHNKAEQRKITLGDAIDNRWLVTSGLKAGDQVIVEGLQGLSAGMTIESTPMS